MKNRSALVFITLPRLAVKAKTGLFGGVSKDARLAEGPQAELFESPPHFTRPAVDLGLGGAIIALDAHAGRLKGVQ